jgi:beta-lactam-binding protein with PASTA domain
MSRSWLRAVLALLILGVAVAAAYPSFAQNAPVPNVVGKDLQTALRELTGAGFVAGTEFGSPVPKGDQRLGKVEKTSPEPGKQAAKGSKVRVWLWREAAGAAAPQNAPVPNVVGKKLAAAIGELRAAGFQIGQQGSKDTVPTGDPRFGTVNRTQPAAGTLAPKGSKVDLWTFAAGGPPPVANVTVPNVMGKKLAAAFAELQAAGFQVGQRGSNGAVPAGDPRGGTVNRMEPPAGKPAAKGSKVDVWVFAESGPPAAAAVAVPNVVGKQLAAAFAELQAAGFQVGQRGSNGAVPAGDPRGGTVNKMEPAPGKPAPKGSKVDVWVWAVASAPAMTVKVPNVVGKNFYEAIRELQAAGLNAQIVETPVPKKDSRAGRVYATKPEAGKPLPRLTVVEILTWMER